MQVEERIARNEELSKSLLESMREEPDAGAFYDQLKTYIRLRFLIDDDPFWSESILELAKYSIRKAIEEAGDPARLSDLGINCAGASSATTKHLLLVISLRKGLGVTLDPDDVAQADTVGGLAELLMKALLER